MNFPIVLLVPKLLLGNDFCKLQLAEPLEWKQELPNRVPKPELGNQRKNQTVV